MPNDESGFFQPLPVTVNLDPTPEQKARFKKLESALTLSQDLQREDQDIVDMFAPLPFDVELKPTLDQIRELESRQQSIEQSQSMEFEIGGNEPVE